MGLDAAGVCGFSKHGGLGTQALLKALTVPPFETSLLQSLMYACIGNQSEVMLLFGIVALSVLQTLSCPYYCPMQIRKYPPTDLGLFERPLPRKG